jgi:hypothetical protein
VLWLRLLCGVHGCERRFSLPKTEEAACSILMLATRGKLHGAAIILRLSIFQL